MNKYKVALIGCGTVGGGVARLLTRDADILRERSGVDLELAYVADKNLEHARSLGLDERLFTDDYTVALSDPNVGLVIELVGGTTIAKKIIEDALRAGKHVVTANKALLAHHGRELLSLARKNGVSIAFEASCGGGIPIIRAIYDGLIANRIDAIYGIVNGTCNYILTKMIKEGTSYKDALAEAQQKGYAEADPFLDVSGTDSAHKLAIMTSMAFGVSVDFDSIPVKGIDELELLDVKYGEELGYVIKLLAVTHRQDNGLCMRVRPAFISVEHPLAWVSDSFNAVSVYGHSTGHTMYYGRGAGDMPTASAVVADIIAIANNTYPVLFNTLPLWQDKTQKATMVPLRENSARYYLRIMVEDRPGVMAKITSILGEHNISISSVLQKEVPEGSKTNHVPIIITTHTVKESDIEDSVKRMEGLDFVSGRPVWISIVDEYPENL
ncbi:homoserine dehydrogenase [Spirochaetia bacterium 38H-sp]|uniref:Homoserine dehydrogenase n=1 Tax=Rarispira pelagica TaxID=3141764 RepID=A0ABU9U9Z2_9SPIR